MECLWFLVFLLDDESVQTILALVPQKEIQSFKVALGTQKLPGTAAYGQPIPLMVDLRKGGPKQGRLRYLQSSCPNSLLNPLRKDRIFIVIKIFLLYLYNIRIN